MLAGKEVDGGGASVDALQQPTHRAIRRGGMMHEFRVWAPRPERVEVVIGGRRMPMRPAGGGWWACRADRAGPGSDYAFSLDGGPPRPDPRSAFQPQGVHGPSRVVDHTSFSLARQRLAGRAAARIGPVRMPRRHLLGRRHLRRGDPAPAAPGRPRRSTSSNCCRWPSSLAGGAGATTASTCSPPTTPTAARTGSSGSSTPPTRTGSAW